MQYFHLKARFSIGDIRFQGSLGALSGSWKSAKADRQRGGHWSRTIRGNFTLAVKFPMSESKR